MQSHYRNETPTQRNLRQAIIGKTVEEAKKIFETEPGYSVCVIWEKNQEYSQFKNYQKTIDKKRLRVGVVNGIIQERYQVVVDGEKFTYLMDWN